MLSISELLRQCWRALEGVLFNLPDTKYINITVFALSLVGCGGGDNVSTVPNTPAAFTLNTTVVIPASTYQANSAELGGWTQLQQARVQCGFGAQKQNTQLDAASLAHAKYLVTLSLAQSTSLLSHTETITNNVWFTGYNPWDRSLFQGYGLQVAEILASTSWNYDISNPPALPGLVQRGSDSMRSLLNTVYHLIGAMYDGPDVGFGAFVQTASIGANRREEYRFGSLNGYQDETKLIKLGTGNLVTYPCQGSSNIPTGFVPANESPNPFPDMTLSQTVGPPIYLKVDSGQTLTLTSRSILKEGIPVSTRVLTRNTDPQYPKEIGSNEVFVVPANPLDSYSTYQINLGGTIDGKPFSRSFTMSTGA